MLVLTRKKEEKLQIGQQITITVLRIKGNAVQLGIEAPRAVRVMRQELLATPACSEAAFAEDPVEITVYQAGESEVADSPSHERLSRLPQCSKAAGSLQAIVSQVFHPLHEERLMTV